MIATPVADAADVNPNGIKIFLAGGLSTFFIIEKPSWQILVPRTSRGRPLQTSPECPLKILFDHPGDITI